MDPSNRQCNGSSYSKICYRRLIACFLDPLQETHCLFLGSVTGDYCLFLGSLYPDNFSFISYFRVEGGFNEIFTYCTVFRKVISFIYEKIYFGDRVPLSTCLEQQLKKFQFFNSNFVEILEVVSTQ